MFQADFVFFRIRIDSINVFFNYYLMVALEILTVLVMIMNAFGIFKIIRSAYILIKGS